MSENCPYTSACGQVKRDMRRQLSRMIAAAAHAGWVHADEAVLDGWHRCMSRPLKAGMFSPEAVWQDSLTSLIALQYMDPALPGELASGRLSVPILLSNNRQTEREREANDANTTLWEQAGQRAYLPQKRMTMPPTRVLLPEVEQRLSTRSGQLRRRLCPQ